MFVCFSNISLLLAGVNDRVLKYLLLCSLLDEVRETGLHIKHVILSENSSDTLKHIHHTEYVRSDPGNLGFIYQPSIA